MILVLDYVFHVVVGGDMKGIILAGGSGTRLYPITRGVCKQLIPIFDKPMVYYPLSILMQAGIREICFITTPHHQQDFINLFGDGSQLGLQLTYIKQSFPNGLAEAFILARNFIAGEPCCLVLGDNLFHGDKLYCMLEDCTGLEYGGKVFAYRVKDPERYGIVSFDENNKVLTIEEKPQNPKSHYAVTGLYFYDGDVSNKAASLKPSARGELEITDLNNIYLQDSGLSVEIFGRGVAWLDTGTFESMHQAAAFVQAVQERQGAKVGCIEEIAWRKGYIDDVQLKKLAEPMHKNEYGEYLFSLLEQNNER